MTDHYVPSLRLIVVQTQEGTTAVTSATESKSREGVEDLSGRKRESRSNRANARTPITPDRHQEKVLSVDSSSFILRWRSERESPISAH